MHVNTQISRGMEKLLARGAGAYLEGMFGLAGLGSCESFRELETHASDAGVPNMPRNMKTLRAKHRCLCDNIKAALPAAVNVKNMLETVAPFPATVSQQLGALTIRNYLENSRGLNLLPVSEYGMGTLGKTAAKVAAKAQKAATKTAAKIAKVQAKEAKQEAKIAAKVAKLEAAGKTAKAAKVIAKDAKQDAKVAAKLVKLENKLTAAQQAVATATQAAAPTITPATVSTPTETAAAVLAQQAQVPVATPQAQQLMQEVVANAAQPGSAVPTQSLTATSESAQFAIPYPSQGGSSQGQPLDFSAPAAEEGGMFAGVNPWVLAGGGVAVLLVLTKVMGKR